MPWENIGECGEADLRERERMIAEVKLGAQYVKLICGQPPQVCKVDAMWHEHDVGEYATVGLFWVHSKLQMHRGTISRVRKTP